MPARAAGQRVLPVGQPLLEREQGVGRALPDEDRDVEAAAVLVRRPSIDEVTEEDWDFQHDVNLKAAFFLNRAAARPARNGFHRDERILKRQTFLGPEGRSDQR